MLLSDVVESEDSYTAEHSRSVVELVNAVADELACPSRAAASSSSRPCSTTWARSPSPRRSSTSRAASTSREFEVMKTHTIEGQFLLDRVGGLLGRVGEIVRSCHERWDGRRLPRRARGRADPVRLADRVLLRRLQRHDERPRLPQGAAPSRRRCASCATTRAPSSTRRSWQALIRVVERRQPGVQGTDEVRAMFSRHAARAGHDG